MSQTSIQNKQTIRYGSAQVLIGSRFDQLIDIGAARSVALKETVTTVDVESDNAGVIASLVSEHKMEVTLDNLEINFKRYFEMRGGIDNLEEYDGKTEVKKEYVVESGTYKLNELIQVPFVNADKSAVVIEKVYKKSSIANILIEEASYEKVGDNGIKITSNSTTGGQSPIKPNSDTLIIVYKQTPARMIRMGTGGKSSTIKPRCIMIVNTDANGKQLRIYLPQASIASGLEFSFPADKSQDVIVNKLSFSATTNSNQKAGEQLAWYEDEQAVYEEDNGIEATEETKEDKKNTEGNPTENNTEQDTKTDTGEDNQTDTNGGATAGMLPQSPTKEDNQAGSEQSPTDSGQSSENPAENNGEQDVNNSENSQTETTEENI